MKDFYSGMGTIFINGNLSFNISADEPPNMAMEILRERTSHPTIRNDIPIAGKERGIQNAPPAIMGNRRR